MFRLVNSTKNINNLLIRTELTSLPANHSCISENHFKHEVFQSQYWVSNYKYVDRGNKIRMRGNEFGTRGNEFLVRGNEFGMRGNEFGTRGNEFGTRGNKFRMRGNEFRTRGNEFLIRGNEIPNQRKNPGSTPELCN